VVGEGALELLFVPGFVWHAEVVWESPAVRRVFDRLGAFARVAVFDKRGQGLSDRPERPTTLEDVAGDALAVMDAAGFARPAVLGISEGGPASILLAAAHPARVSSLVLLVSNGPRVLDAPDYDAGVPAAVLDATAARWEAEWGGPVGLPLFAAEWVGDPQAAAWWAKLLRSGVSLAGLRRIVAGWREQDVRDVLPAVHVPTLVISRSEDRLVPPAASRLMAASIPGARQVVVPGPHLPAAGDVDAWLDEVEEFLTGERHAPEPDRVLATVLFTDIVGSTERAGALGDRRWRDLLAAHDAIVRRELARHRGREVKHLGDGVLAAFDGPARAIRCAEAIVEAVRPLGIEVRAGVHTGECEARGDDLAGMAVHIGARVAALAGPSEVLVSGTVRDLVVGSGLGLADRGEHRLKGVPDAWRLFALERAPALARAGSSPAWSPSSPSS
jgi:class 3 adenylate cyclase